jgi:hypothetical protein
MNGIRSCTDVSFHLFRIPYLLEGIGYIGVMGYIGGIGYIGGMGYIVTEVLKLRKKIYLSIFKLRIPYLFYFLLFSWSLVLVFYCSIVLLFYCSIYMTVLD